MTQQPWQRIDGKLVLMNTGIPLESWVIAEDLSKKMFSDMSSLDVHHAVGFVYIDHEAGMTLRVEAFVSLEQDGSITDANESNVERGLILMRNNVFDRLRIQTATPALLSTLGLPLLPEWLSSYNYSPEFSKIRQAEILDPFRVPGFPDDVHFLLVSKTGNLRPEMPFARLERQLDATQFEGVLLNKPASDFGVNQGDTITIVIAKQVDQAGNSRPIAIHIVDI